MKTMPMSKTLPPSLYNISSALKKSAALAAAGLAACLSAEEVIFEGGSLNVPASGTVAVSTAGTPTQSAYSYYNHATGQTAQIQITKGSLVHTLLPFMLGRNYDVTFKPVGDGSVWAQLDGDTSHQLITLNEPVAGPASITVDKIMLVNGRAASGGAVAISSGGGGSISQLTLHGDMIFQNNVATSRGGALSTGAGTLEFTGNVIFEGNTATEGTTGAGGAIDFNAAGQSNEKLIFSGTTYFLRNLAHRGGAIFAGVDAAKTIEFNGNTIFEGNRAGNLTGNATTGSRGSEGGAIYVDGGNSRSTVKFNASTAFQSNASASQGGAIYMTQGDIIFSDDGPFQGSKSFVFSRNVSTFASTAGSAGGGAISAGTYGTNTNSSAVYFLATTSTLTMTGNVATVLYNNDPSLGSSNGGIGGAIRAMGGVYLLSGASEFVGNQSKNGGGAIHIHTGGTPVGNTYRTNGIIYNDNTETYKYKLQINGNASFRNNLAGRDGGAILGFNGTVPINMYIGGNTEFTDNTAGGRGGAIAMGTAGSLLTLDARTGHITFLENRHQTSVSSAFTLADVNAILGNTSGANGYRTFTGGSLNDIWFTNIGALELNATAGNTIYFGGGVSSNSVAVAVTKTGAGTVVFGTNSVSDMPATTTISAGSFILEAGARYDTGAGTLTVAGGATLGGSGTMRAVTNAAAGFTILVGDASSPVAQRLSFTNNLTIASGTIKLDLFDTSGSYDSIALDTSKTFSATGITYLDVTALGNGAYNIITAGGINAGAGNFQLRAYGGALTRRNQGSTVAIVGNNVVINGVMNNLATTWNSTSGIWRDGVDTAWIATTDSNEKFFRNGDRVTFTNTGAGTIAIDAAGVKVADMIVDSSADYTFTGSAGITTVDTVSGAYITAGQKLTKRGAGTLTFENAANTFAEGIDIEAGTLVFNNAAQVAVNPGAAITFTGDATLKLNAGAMTLASNLAIATGKTGTLDMGAHSLTLAGAISGAATASLVKTGAGTLTLTADSSAYAGATRIQAGSLLLASNGAKLGGAITLDSGATLVGIGESTGSLTAGAGSLIQVGIDGVTTPQNLTLHDLTMNGAKLNIDLYTHGVDATPNLSDTLTLTGAYTIGTGANILDIQTLKVGTYNLGNFGAFADQAWEILIAGQSQVDARQNGSIANVAGDLILTTTADLSRDSVWTGNSGGTWNISQTNWDVSDSTATTYAGGDSVTFNGTATNRDIFIEGTANVSGMDVSGAANHTFTGGGIRADSSFIIPGSSLSTADGKLTKSGAGTLTFANAGNSFRGGIEISGGAIAFNNGGQLNTLGSGITFTASGTLKANATGMTLAEDIIIGAAMTAAIDTNGNNLAYTGALTALGLDSTLAKTGQGTLYLDSDSASYTGNTSVAAGALLLASDTVALGGAIDIATGATFGGIGAAAGAITAQAGSTIQVAAPGATGTLTLGALALADTAAITGNGTLKANTIAIGAVASDKVYAAITSGNALTIDAATSGAGTLVKQDLGTLTLSGTAALGHAATQIQGGLLAVQDVTRAEAGTLTHSFVMDGGWLDLTSSGTDLLFWRNTTLESGENAALGGIIGERAVIYLGNGTTAFTIGSPDDVAKRDIAVYVVAGDGQTAFLTGTNYFDGSIFIQSGTLVVTSAQNLGTTDFVVLRGGELRVSANSDGVMSTNKRLSLATPHGIVTVDAGVEASFGNLGVADSGSNGVLVKRGDGALIFTGVSSVGDRLDRIDLEAGTLGAMSSPSLGVITLDESQSYIVHSATINVLGANTTVRIGAGARLGNAINLNGNTLSLEVPAGENAALGFSAITGSGGINKTGHGTLVLSSTYNSLNTYSGTTRVTQGALRAGDANAFSPNSTTYTVEREGTLQLNAFVSSIPMLHNNGAVHVGVATTGTASWSSFGALQKAATLRAGEYHAGEDAILYLNWGITSDSDYRLKFDRVTFEPGAVVTGTTQIVFVYSSEDAVMYNTLPRRGASDHVDMLSHTVIADNINAGLLFTGTFNVSGRKYIFRADEYGDLVVEKQGYVPEWQALIAIDSQALFAGKAALESLSRRFTTLRVETGVPKRGYDAWIGGMHREDTMRDTVYEGARITSNGVQAGVDFVDGSISTVFFLGATFDYISTSASLDADFGYLNMEPPALNRIRGESKSYGFGLYGGMRDGPWYIEASARASRDKYTGSNVIYRNYELTGSSFGGSIETGYSFTGSESGWVFEPQAQIMMQRSTINPASVESDQYADDTFVEVDTVQSMVGRAGLKIYKGFEYKPGCKLTPYVRASLMHEFAGKNKVTINETPVDNDLGGSVGMIELGLNARLTPRWDVALDAAYYYGTRYNGYSLNGGIRFNW